MSILIKRVAFFALIIFVLSIAYVSAATQIEVTHEDLKSRVSPGETAEFLFKVKNNMNTEDTFMISVNDLDIYPFGNIIESAEFEPKIVTLKPGESVDVNLKLKILKEAIPNVNYKTFLAVKSSNDPDIWKNEYVIVSVLAPNDLVEILTSMPDKVVASKGQTLEITLTSKVNTILKDVSVSVSSEFFQEGFKQNIYYGVPVVKQINYDLDPSTKPGKYRLSVKVFYNDRMRGELLKEFEIITNRNIMQSDEVESGFLVKRYDYERDNQGNVEMEETVFLPLETIERLFTTSSLKPSKKTDAGYEWTFTIKPGEKRNVDVKTDYRTVFYGTIIIVLFALGLWYYMHKTIVIKKHLYHIKDNQHGLAELKILLKVRNKGNPLKIVKVVDIVPGLMKIVGEYGTLKPAKIESTYSGTRIIWEVHGFEMGDERLISYKLESKTPLHHTVTLPPAAVIYKKLSRAITKTSNKVIYVPKSANKEKHAIG